MIAARLRDGNCRSGYLLAVMRADEVLREFVERARTVSRRPVLDAAAGEVLTALEAAGIEALLLKGAALARLLYGPDEHRGYLDIDLLVGPGERAAAGRVLETLGYGEFIRATGLQIFPDDPHAEVWVRGSRGLELVAVDLHWRLPGCEADPERVWAVLRAHRAWISLDGIRAPILNRPGLALHLALHLAQHGPDDRKAVGDLGRALDRWPADLWRAAAGIADEIGATEAFSAGLRLVPAGAAKARDLDLPEADVLLKGIADRKDRPRGSFHLRAFIEADGLLARAVILRQSLFPQRKWILREIRWAHRGPVWLALAYALHLARSSRWAARAWRFSRKAGRLRS